MKDQQKIPGVSAARTATAAKRRPAARNAARSENPTAQAAPRSGASVRPTEVTELSMPYTHPSSPLCEWRASRAERDGISPPTLPPARAWSAKSCQTSVTQAWGR